MSFGAWLTCKCSNIDRLLMTCLSKLWSRWTSLSNSCCRGLKYGKPYVICIAYAVLFEVARPSHCAYSGIRHVPRKFPRHSVRRFVFVAAVSTSALISVQACASLRRVALVNGMINSLGHCHSRSSFALKFPSSHQYVTCRCITKVIRVHLLPRERGLGFTISRLDDIRPLRIVSGTSPIKHIWRWTLCTSES
jgi:hypothetical protein